MTDVDLAALRRDAARLDSLASRIPSPTPLRPDDLGPLCRPWALELARRQHDALDTLQALPDMLTGEADKLLRAARALEETEAENTKLFEDLR